VSDKVEKQKSKITVNLFFE